MPETRSASPRILLEFRAGQKVHRQLRPAGPGLQQANCAFSSAWMAYAAARSDRAQHELGVAGRAVGEEVFRRVQRVGHQLRLADRPVDQRRALEQPPGIVGVAPRIPT